MPTQTNKETGAIQPRAETMQCCGNCRYYAPLSEIDPPEDDEDDEPEDDDLTGICRRFPPHMFPGITPTPVFPDVSGTSGWCGEFIPKP